MTDRPLRILHLTAGSDAGGLSGYLLQLCEALVPPERITVIPHGIRVDQFPIPTESQRLAARAALGLAPTDLVAAYVGRLDYPKNEDWLLDLAESSRTALPTLKIPLAGDGPHEA